MSSSLKSFLWILLGFPLLFLFFGWAKGNWNLFYISIPIGIVVAFIGYFVSKKHEGNESSS